MAPGWHGGAARGIAGWRPGATDLAGYRWEREREKKEWRCIVRTAEKCEESPVRDRTLRVI